MGNFFRNFMLGLNAGFFGVHSHYNCHKNYPPSISDCFMMQNMTGMDPILWATLQQSQSLSAFTYSNNCASNYYQPVDTSLSSVWMQVQNQQSMTQLASPNIIQPPLISPSSSSIQQGTPSKPVPPEDIDLETLYEESNKNVTEKSDLENLNNQYKALYGLIEKYSQKSFGNSKIIADMLLTKNFPKPENLSSCTSKDLNVHINNLKKLYSKCDKDEIKKMIAEGFENNPLLVTLAKDTKVETNKDKIERGTKLTFEGVNIICVLSNWNNIFDKHFIDYLCSQSNHTETHEATANNAHKALKEYIKDNKIDSSELSPDLKKEFDKAWDEFKKYKEDKLTSQYSKIFDNMYRLTRLALAELVETKYNEFEFMGDDNPYKQYKYIMKTVEEDLKSENISEVKS